ncbi:MAG: glycosyltransferase [Usitatibacter sp.]
MGHRLKVLHVPYTYFPDPVGGTEIYVRSLVANLARSGVTSVICAPGASARSYVHAGVQVHRFAGRHSEWPLEFWYDEGDSIAAEAFAALLALEKPDVVHVHAHTTGVSLRLASKVRAYGVPMVFTYHTATVSCETGGLLRWGHTPCDGRMDASRCCACNLARLGMPRAFASLVGRAPQGVGRIVEKCGLRGPAWTALRMSALLGRKHAAIRAFLEIADVVVAPSQWVASLLEANALPAAKVAVCAQGLVRHPSSDLRKPLAAIPPLRVAVLARLDRSKGVHVLVEALAASRDLDVVLDVFGVRQPGEPGYFETVSRAITLDPRIRLCSAVPHDEVPDLLARYHVLAVPSQIMETGPLVVLEAFAAGIPVIGSDLGGIRERVIDGRNGLLVRAADRGAWAASLSRLIASPGMLQSLSRGITAPPTMEGVSAKMEKIYRALTSPSAVRAPANRTTCV